MADLQHVERLSSGILRPYIHQFTLEYFICAISKYNINNIARLAGLGPKSLKRIHTAAVAFEADYFAVGTGNRRTGRQRHAYTDGATGHRHPVMLLRTGGKGHQSPTGRYGFINNNGVFRH